MSSLWSNYTQLFPPKAKFTEASVPDLAGKVYIVTGSNTGIGKDLARILYEKNAKVYIAARSEDKALSAIAEIKAAAPASTGALHFLRLDLADLSTIRASADAFLAQESQLHTLFNNAGVLATGDVQRTAQGHELNMGVNCVGTFLFTKLLTPTLVATAKTAPPGSVRVVWVSSSAAEHLGFKDTGVDFDDMESRGPKPAKWYMARYGISKAGNYLHAVEFAQRYRAEGVVSVPLNPGNLASDLWRGYGRFMYMCISLVLHPPINGAYTLLYAGLSPEVGMEASGSWIIPFGRLGMIPKYKKVTKSKAEGGNGASLLFWDWCEEQVARFV